MNRNIIILLFLLTPHNLIESQELNESFLKSLPANLRSDFLAQSEDIKDDDRNIPSPETRIDNLEQALADAEQTLRNIKQDLNQQQDSNHKELQRIGEKFFQSFQSTFLPINEPNLDSTYILDVGDKLTLQLIGQKNLNNNLPNNLTIKRDGAINIPDIGNVTLAGLSLQEASELIKKLISQAFIGVEAFISLSELRDINVIVVGNIRNPGMYTLSGGSTPLSLINAAGGIDENGSYRKIIHKRNGITLQEVDLYEIFLKGNINYKYQLRSGDSLVVLPKLPEIYVSGVSNSGIYEIKENNKITEFIETMGIRSNTDYESIRLSRLESGELNESVIDFKKLQSIDFRDGDAIQFFSVSPLFNQVYRVKLTGNVKVPGLYNIEEGATLSEVILKAGGYTDYAYPYGGILIRTSAKELEEKMRDKTYESLLRYIISSPAFLAGGFGSGSENIITLLSLIKEFEPSGRMISEFDLNKIARNPYLDTRLQDGDSIHIPAFSDEIFVFGAVMNPGSMKFSSNYLPKDYIKLAGGFNRQADKSRLIIISPNGEAISGDTSLNIFNFNKNELLPGSVIYVPDIPGKIDGINLASAVAPILSSFALSVASLNSINN